MALLLRGPPVSTNSDSGALNVETAAGHNPQTIYSVTSSQYAQNNVILEVGDQQTSSLKCGSFKMMIYDT